MYCLFNLSRMRDILVADRAAWRRVADFPSTAVCRIIVYLADFAAADPARWTDSREFLASGRGFFDRTALMQVEYMLPRDGFMPAELPFSAVPSAPQGASSATLARAIWLADAAAFNPEAWQVARLRYSADPELPARVIAKMTGLATRRVAELYNYYKEFVYEC